MLHPGIHFPQFIYEPRLVKDPCAPRKSSARVTWHSGHLFWRWYLLVETQYGELGIGWNEAVKTMTRVASVIFEILSKDALMVTKVNYHQEGIACPLKPSSQRRWGQKRKPQRVNHSRIPPSRHHYCQWGKVFTPHQCLYLPQPWLH